MWEGYFEKCIDGVLVKRFGLVYEGFIVCGVGSIMVFVCIVFDVVFGIFGFDFYKFIIKFMFLLSMRKELQ